MFKKMDLNKKTKLQYLKDLNLSEEDIKRFINSKKKPKKGEVEQLVEKGYTVYTTNSLGRIANYFFSDIVNDLVTKYPDSFKKLFYNLRMSGVKVLSRTYVSMVFFSSIIAFSFFTLLSFIYFFLADKAILFPIVKAFFVGILAGVSVFAFVYLYPSMTISNRSRKIKNELPFVLLHMSAVAGSGARPETIFKLLLESGEYKELGTEIKKIVNYINLFGYDLTTALRSVAENTPSPQFKELLNGMIATTESGGDIKDYLKDKAEDYMDVYKAERKKYVEGLAIYSDVYTGVLIAAPLLFLVALAIINVVGGGNLFGFSVSGIGMIGTFVVLPILNAAFFVFVDIMHPEV